MNRPVLAFFFLTPTKNPAYAAPGYWLTRAVIITAPRARRCR
jgi:hypothetical protein